MRTDDLHFVSRTPLTENHNKYFERTPTFQPYFALRQKTVTHTYMQFITEDFILSGIYFLGNSTTKRISTLKSLSSGPMGPLITKKPLFDIFGTIKVYIEISIHTVVEIMVSVLTSLAILEKYSLLGTNYITFEDPQSSGMNLVDAFYEKSYFTIIYD